MNTEEARALKPGERVKWDRGSMKFTGKACWHTAMSVLIEWDHGFGSLQWHDDMAGIQRIESEIAHGQQNDV